MVSKPKIYLAGKMQGLTFDKMNEHRIEAATLLEENFHTINPCDFYNFKMDKSEYTDSEVKEFDLMQVKNSHIVLVDLEHPDSIGTAIEVHMAHDVWGIPVIGYGGCKDEIHPWIKLNLTKWCDTLEDAVNHINKFYLPNF